MELIDKAAVVTEIEKLKLCTMDEHMKFYSESAEAEYYALCKVEEIIDSLQEEPKFKTGDRIKPVDSCLGAPRTIVDICNSWYVTDQGTLDFEYEDNWESVEEPVSDDLEKAADKYSETIESYYPNGMFDSGDIYSAFKAGANWQKEKDESITEDLGEYINELSKQFPEVSFAKLSRISVRVAKWQKEQDQSTIELAEDHAMLAGMNKMEQQMLAKAIDATCFGFQGAALFSFRLPADSYLVGSKVKVIIINED